MKATGPSEKDRAQAREMFRLSDHPQDKKVLDPMPTIEPSHRVGVTTDRFGLNKGPPAIEDELLQG